MRSGVLLRQAQIPYQEVGLRFDSFSSDSQFKTQISALSPTGKVPLLLDTRDGRNLAVWDTLAIAEYLAEQFPQQQLWPGDPALRARARSVCAEMHSGFGQLRSLCPMNIEAKLSELGQLLWRDQAGLRSDVARIVSMWEQLLQSHGGPLLFGEFCIADAYFAPVVMRLKTYQLPVPATIQAYMERVCQLSGVQSWVQAALAEHDFLDFEEPYRLHP